MEEVNAGSQTGRQHSGKPRSAQLPVVGTDGGREKLTALQPLAQQPTAPLKMTLGNARITGASAATSPRGASRDTSRLSSLSKDFALEFAFDLDGIKLPEKICFNDFLSNEPATQIDVSGWMISPSLLVCIGSNCKESAKSIILSDTIGFTVKMMERIRGFKKVRKLYIDNTGIDITFQAAQILGSLSKLMDLNISGCKVDITSFSIICNTCQQLRQLTCQACLGLDDFCLQALAACMQRFRRLHSVDLSRGIEYSDEGFLTVLGATPKLLTRLNMANCANITTLSMTALRTSMPALVYLDVSNLKLLQSTFEWISEGCTNVETLLMANCVHLDDMAMVRFGKKCLKLKRLDISRCEKVTDKGMIGFFEGLKNAASLKLCGDSGLRSLDLSSNIDCGGPAVQALASYEKVIQAVYGSGIEELKMNGLSMVTADALMAMWKACASIKRFEMAVELKQAVTHRKSMMPHISDEILVEAQYHTLVDVTLSGCCLISDDGLCSLVQKCCSNLTAVNVSYCGLITDKFMYYLAQYSSRKLRRLNISGCNKITNHGIIALCTDYSQFGESSVDLLEGLVTDEGPEVDAVAPPPPAAMDGIEGESLGGRASIGSHSQTSSKKHHAGLFQMQNPFSRSEGCLMLEHLEMNGLHKVNDAGVVAISSLANVEVLSIRNLEYVTDNPLLLLAESCRHLRSLDISGIDMVSIQVVKHFAELCYKLETFNCELCNFTSGEYAKVVRPLLPLGIPNGLRSKLEPRPRPILEYNRFVVDTREKRIKSWVITKFARFVIAWARVRHEKVRRREAIATIKRVWYEYLQRHHLFHLWGSRNAKKRAANILQQWWRRMEGCLNAKWKVRRMRKRLHAAALVQRVFRGHMARKRTHNRFRRLYDHYTKIGHMAHKYWVLVHAREFHRRLLKVQSVGRMFPHKLNFILFKRALVTLQGRTRSWLKRRRACRRAMNWILSDLEGHAVAANIIRKNWRIRMFNKTMSTFVFICAIYWRSIDDEKDWRIVQLQSWYRGSIVRLHKWRVEEKPRIIARKATKIQALWWRYKARCWYVPFKKKKKMFNRAWRKFMFESCCHMRLGKILRPFQKMFKLYFWRISRLRAAEKCQKYYRGYLARKAVTDREIAYRNRRASQIQRAMRISLARKWRRGQHALRHMSVWKIQRRIHSLFDGEALMRIQRKKAVKRRKEILEEKQKLLTVTRWGAMNRRKEEFMNIWARRIQKRFRKYYTAKIKKAEAARNKAAMEAETTEEIISVKRTRALFGSLGNPLVAMSRVGSAAFRGLVAGGQLITYEDEPRLTNAILKYHTVSIEQVGVIGAHFTVGEGEHKAFTMQQHHLKTSNKSFYECLELDLSGQLRLKAFLWIMKGKGKDCLTSLTMKKKPANTSLAELKSRASAFEIKCVKCVWHQHLPFELHGGQTIKAGKGGFAISDIQIVNTEEAGEDLELKGYTLIQNMQEYGFNTFLWAFARTPADADDIFKLGSLDKETWCDARLMKIIYSYNLSLNDVRSLRSTYEAILGSSITETARVTEVFKHFGFDYVTDIAKFFVKAVEPKREKEISFSEYVHMVASCCMMGKTELMRFLFGQMDVALNAFLKRDQFVTLIEYMAEGSAGGNATVWMMQYDSYKDRKLDSLFFGGFESFCTKYRGVMWSTEMLQQAIRKANLGPPYWENKMDQFVEQRRALKVKLV